MKFKILRYSVVKHKVYKIFFKEINAIYIGCTNDLKNRRDQHRENIRKNKSAFGRFVNKYNLSYDFNMEVIAEFRDRHEALMYEKKITTEYDKSGEYIVINDNYTSKCSRKGKNIGNTAKQWVVINLSTKKVITVSSLRNYAITNNMDYKGLQHCGTHKSHVCGKIYKVFKLDEWETFNEQEQEYYISGKFLDDINRNIKEKHIKRCSKKYEVMKPDGTLEIVVNLDKFARENNISEGNLHSSFTTGKTAKGFKVVRKL